MHKFPYFRIIYVFCLIYVIFAFPYFGHNAFMHHACLHVTGRTAKAFMYCLTTTSYLHEWLFTLSKRARFEATRVGPTDVPYCIDMLHYYSKMY